MIPVLAKRSGTPGEDLDSAALEPDGAATACKAVRKWVRLPPALLTVQLHGSDYIL